MRGEINFFEMKYFEENIGWNCKKKKLFWGSVNFLYGIVKENIFLEEEKIEFLLKIVLK